MAIRLVFLASQKLFLFEAGKQSEIQSTFGQEVIDRALRNQQKHAWKFRERGGDPFRGQILWGNADAAENSTLPVHITSVSRGQQEGELLYVLETDSIGGVFSYDLGEKEELRVFHREQFQARDLAMHPSGEAVAASLPGGFGANIAIGRGDGRRLEEVTEGDSFDSGPSWVPGRERTILFHSAGIIRNGHGHAIGQAPSSIEQLDLETGEMTTLLEDGTHDYLEPKMDEAGNLWFIRRPYESMGKRSSPLDTVKDILFFPYRLIRAVIHFFNAFSMFFSKKPLLTSAGGPKTEEQERQQMWLWGRMVDATAGKGKTGGSEGIIPRDWELVRRSPAGEEEVVARHVGSYDLTKEGDPVFSTGTGIFLHRTGKKEKLTDGFLIQTVRVV